MTDPVLSRSGKGQAVATPPALWDPLVRITHWGIAAVVLGNFALNKAGGTWHVTLGWLGLTLLALRLIWGLFGPRPARFSSFPPNPAAAMRHLVALVKGRPPHYLSHNPAGAMMVYALWACLALVTLTGLVQTGFESPLARAQDEVVVAQGDWATLAAKSEADDDEDGEAGEMLEEAHEILANLLLLLAALHVLGVVVEGRAMRRNLIAPMLLGSRREK